MYTGCAAYVAAVGVHSGRGGFVSTGQIGPMVIRPRSVPVPDATTLPTCTVAEALADWPLSSCTRIVIVYVPVLAYECVNVVLCTNELRAALVPKAV